MKQLIKIIIPFIMAFALGALVFRSKPAPRNECIQQIQAKAINYPVITYAPVVNKQTFFETNTIHDTIPVNIDSLAVIRDYFSKRYYRDTIINDTNALIIISDTIFKNRIFSRSLQRKFFPHLYTVQAPVTRKIFLGGGIIAYPDRFGLAAGGIYIDRHERAFGILFDPIGKGIFISAYWKINLKRKR